MSAPKDGGPAFPNEPRQLQSGDTRHVWDGMPGMSLRDYFAGQIIGALINSQVIVEKRLDVPERTRECWIIADAMLAARNKEP